MIDVIIPAYNCEKTLDRTLSSFVCQTDKDFKIYLIDDCSTQDIKTIVDRYNNLLDITYIRNEHNVGCGMSRQVGIDNSHSNYFMFCDSDDIVMPYIVNVFNRTVKYHENVDLVKTSFYMQDLRDNDHRLFEISSNLTWCHGILYSRKLFNDFNIKNLSQYTKWGDDNYINIITSTLSRNTIVVPLYTYIWMQDNQSSITNDATQTVKDKAHDITYLNCIFDSFHHILKYKNDLSNLETTVTGVKKYTVDKYKNDYNINKIYKKIKKLFDEHSK